MLKTPLIMFIKFNFFAVRVYIKKNFVEHQIYWDMSFLSKKRPNVLKCSFYCSPVIVEIRDLTTKAGLNILFAYLQPTHLHKLAVTQFVRRADQVTE